MNVTPHRYELSVAPRGLFEIPDAAGIQVTCKEGCVWITLDHDTRDIVLEAGESFSGTQHRRALVFALQASTVAMRPCAGKPCAPHTPSFSFMPPHVAA